MVKNLKKLVVPILMVATMLCSVFTASAYTSNSWNTGYESAPASIDGKMGVIVMKDANSAYVMPHPSHITYAFGVDGTLAYCIWPGATWLQAHLNNFVANSVEGAMQNLGIAAPNSYYASGASGVTREVAASLVNRLAAFTDASNRYGINNRVNWAAIQILIWETMTGERDSNFNKVQSSAKRSGANWNSSSLSWAFPSDIATRSVNAQSAADKNAIMAEYDRIVAAMKSYNVSPSFNGTSQTLSGIGTSVTFTDTNGVLQYYNVTTSDSRVTISKNGNSLTVTSNTNDSISNLAINLSRNIPVNKGQVYINTAETSNSPYEPNSNQPVMKITNNSSDVVVASAIVNQAQQSFEGYLALNKSTTGSLPPTGAEYTVYDGNTAVGKFTVNASGVGQAGSASGVLSVYNATTFKVNLGSAGSKTLSIKETKLPNSHNGDTIIWKDLSTGNSNLSVTVDKTHTENSPLVANVRNSVEQYGYLQIKKESANPSYTNGNPNYSLAGAKFSVSGRSEVLTTDANGLTNKVKLPVGTYNIAETQASKGFLIADGTSVVISADNTNTNPKIVNVKEPHITDPIAIKIHKVSGTPANLKDLRDATFTVKYYPVANKADIANSTPARTETYKSNLMGIVNINDEYPLGWLTIEETTVPVGYSKIGWGTIPSNANVSVDGEILYVRLDESFENSMFSYEIDKVNNELKYNVTINKQDKNTVTVQGDVKNWTGAVLQLIYAGPVEGQTNEPYTQGQVVKSVNVTADGKAVFADIPTGKYQVKETAANDGYKVNTTPLNIEVKGTVTEVFNQEPETLTLEIVKKDADTGVVLAGAVYEIKNDSANAIYWNGNTYNKGAVITTVTTNADGKAMVEGLPRVATYTVTETKAPDGYLLANPTSQTKSGTKTTTKLEYEFRNARIKFDVTINKQDELLITAQGDIENFNGTAFKIRSKNAYDVVYNGHTVKNNQFLKNTNGEDYILTISNGKSVEFKGIPGGMYEAVEVSATTGMILDSTPVAINGNVTTNNAKVSVNKNNNPELTELKIKKNDEFGARRIDMVATFEVKNTSTNSIKFKVAPSVTVGTKVSGFEANKEYKSGDVIGVIKTNADGNATITGLNKKATYTVKETVAPTGFRLSPNNTLEKSDTFTFEFTDKMMEFDVEVLKLDNETSDKNSQGDVKNFNGVEITLYNDNAYSISYNGKTIAPGAVVDTKVITEGNKVVFEGLEWGKYHAEETKTIDGYSKSNDKPSVDSTKDTSFTDNKMYKESKIGNTDIPHSLTLIKQDADTKGDNPANIPMTATYKVYNWSPNAVVYGTKEIPGNPDKVLDDKYLVGTFTTVQGTDGKGGKVTISGLPWATFMVEEIQAPEGYDTVGYDANGNALPTNEATHSYQIVAVHDKDESVTFRNEIFRYKLVVEKGSKDTDSQLVLGDLLSIEGMEITIKTKQNIFIQEHTVNGVTYPAKLYKAGDLIEYEGKTNILLVNGKWESIEKWIPYGQYVVEEVKAPVGFLLDSLPVDVDVRNNTPYTTVYVGYNSEAHGEDEQDGDIANHMERIHVSIFKSLSETNGNTWSNGSAFANPEEGAVFTIVPLKDMIAEYGEKAEYTNMEVLAVYNKLKADPSRGPWTSKDLDGNTIILHEYDQITTGADGFAHTKATGLVKYCAYVIANTGASSPEIELIPYAKMFDGKAEYFRDKKVVHDFRFEFWASNALKTFYLELVKKATNTTGAIKGIKDGEVITLNSANFMIYRTHDHEGNEINPPQLLSQKVGRNYYNVFRTTSDNGVGQTLPVFYDANNSAPGTIVTPQKVQAGTYDIYEVETPFGFTTSNKITVKISAGDEYISEVMPDGDEVFTVEVLNKAAYGTINVFKSLKDLEGVVLADAKTEIEKVEITVFADEDIYSPQDGSLVHAKDSVVAKGKLVYDATTKEGKITFTNLSLGKDNNGARYRIEETSIPATMKANATKEYRTLTYKDDKIENIEIVADPVRFTNEWTETELIKVDQDGKPFVGAVLTVMDGNKEIHRFTSKATPEKVLGLEKNKEYKLHEVKTLEGWVLALDVPFTLNNDDTLTKVTMINKKFEIFKVDTAGEEVPGAELTVTDKSGTVVDTWISTDKPHAVKGLKVGETYTFKEVAAPNGYVMVNEWTFTVKDDGKNEYYEITDIRVEVSKKNIMGEEVIGAELVVYDADNKVVDSWTSTKDTHFISGLKEGGKYRIVETAAPNGYVKMTEVEFEIKNYEVIATDKEDMTIDLVDKIVVVKKVDADGNFVSNAKLEVRDEKGNVVDSWTTITKEHMVSGLEEGKTYTLVEVNTPDGYVKASDIIMEITLDKDTQTFTMIDKQVGLSKVDMAGEEVPGAEITITDKDGNVVDKWTSTNEIHFISGLEVGKTYTFTEIAAPNGYVKASSFEFEVTDDGVNQYYAVVDKRVEIFKSDIGGEEVVGAELVVYDENGNEVDKWTSTEEPHAISGLEVGKTYTLKEEAAPNGLVKITEWTFTVTDDGVDQFHRVEDMRVLVNKVDENNQFVIGATFEVRDENGNVVDTFTTDGKPYAISNLEEGKTYTLYETEVPEGYIGINEDGITFTVESYETSDGKEDLIIDILNTQFFVSKTDVGGEEIEGAELTVYNENGEIVDEWISTKEPHPISGLRQGHKYILREVASPNGYVKITEWEFEITPDYSVSEFHEVIDKRVAIGKVDANGNLIEGALLQVLDKDGNVVDEWTSTLEYHFVDNLEEGKTYILHEVEAPEGYVRAKDIEFTVTLEKVNQEFNMTNIQVLVYKTDVSGEEVEGAKLVVYDKDGNVVDSWVSTKEPHAIRNLEVGETYTLIEEAAPNGYVKISKWEFTINEEGKVDEAHYIEDMRVAIKKVDTKGNAVIGAELGIIDAENVKLAIDSTSLVVVIDFADIEEYLVDRWTTDGEVHFADNLEEGKTYYLVELNTPDGYVTANPVKFTVKNLGKDIEIEMVDTQVFVEKVDTNGNAVEGAKFWITRCGDCGNVATDIIDQWVSDGTPHAINGLVNGMTYVLHEIAPDGYVRSQPIKFTVNNNEDMTISVVNTRISVDKVDIDGNRVIGAHFIVYDKDGKIVDEFTTTEEIYYISGLVEGEDYTIEETLAPAGLYRMPEIKGFTAEHGVDFTMSITDDPIEYRVRKVDENGKFIKGSRLQIIDKETEEVVFEWVTEKEEFDISKYLVDGRTYILHEVEAPFGYELSEDIEFTVEWADKEIIVSMTDMAKTLYVKIAKADKDDVKFFLKGAEITIYDEEGNIVLDVDGKECIGVTDENGEVSFRIAYDQDKKYFAKETKAPSGYHLNEDLFEVKVSEDYKFMETDLIKISILDASIIIPPVTPPDTGDTFPMGLYIASAVIAMCGIGFILLKGKKEVE